MPRGVSDYLKPKSQTVKELDEATGETPTPTPPPQQPAPKPTPKPAPDPKPKAWWER